tara:strand:+ start:72 stop:467 length:396 start_codon:yes stop_codon:yes gene_type:complete
MSYKRIKASKTTDMVFLDKGSHLRVALPNGDYVSITAYDYDESHNCSVEINRHSKSVVSGATGLNGIESFRDNRFNEPCAFITNVKRETRQCKGNEDGDSFSYTEKAVKVDGGGRQGYTKVRVGIYNSESN